MWHPPQLDGKMWKYLFMIFLVNFFRHFTTFQLTAGFLKDLDGDKVHVLVLFFLYVLQARLKCQNPPLVYFFYANIASDWIIQCLGHPPWPYQCSASYPHRQVSFFCIILLILLTIELVFNVWSSRSLSIEGIFGSPTSSWITPSSDTSSFHPSSTNYF